MVIKDSREGLEDREAQEPRKPAVLRYSGPQAEQRGHAAQYPAAGIAQVYASLEVLSSQAALQELIRTLHRVHESKCRLTPGAKLGVVCHLRPTDRAVSVEVHVRAAAVRSFSAEYGSQCVPNPPVTKPESQGRCTRGDHTLSIDEQLCHFAQ